MIHHDSEVLILGSFPGGESLKQQKYYAHPQNIFWKMMADIHGIKSFESDDQKIHFLKKQKVALWDVLASCRRKGSSDASILKAAPNDIQGLLRKAPKIRRILLNGRFADKAWRLFMADSIAISASYVPSTSPAHASMSYQDKLKIWKAQLKAT